MHSGYRTAPLVALVGALRCHDGSDDSPFAALTPISLTSVRTPRRLMGELAGRLVKEAIHTRQRAEPREIMLPVELVTRGSVGPPRRQPRLDERTRRAALER